MQLLGMLKESIIFAMPMANKRVIVSVTNDLVTDQRVHKVCTYLHDKGCDVTLVGRKLKSSAPLNRDYKTKRMRLLFAKGALFYAEYNKRLFFYLLFKKADVLLANDLDTLLANKTASRFKSCELVYDSHEFFTEVPELVNRPKVQKIWERIERRIFPKLKHIYTVNNSIAGLYKDRYNKEIKVVRNVSRRYQPTNVPTKEELGLPVDKRIIILQGAGINIDRGSEELLEAMNHLSNFHLLIVGAGDVVPLLKDKAKGRTDVTFIGRKNYESMMEYTANADIGVSLDKDTNMNYRYSLPNKIFDYIHAGVPVLVSNLVEVRSIIDHYQVGSVIPSHDPEQIAESIRTFFLGLDQDDLSKKLAAAANELNWDNETKVLDSIYDPILNS